MSVVAGPFRGYVSGIIAKTTLIYDSNSCKAVNFGWDIVFEGQDVSYSTSFYRVGFIYGTKNSLMEFVFFISTMKGSLSLKLFMS